MPFDPFDPSIFDDPVPSYHWLLEHHPLYWCEERRIWVLSRFDDVWEATRDWQTYSSEAGNVYGDANPEMRKRGSESIVMMDPPRHTRLRGLASRAFTLRRMQAMRERIRELTLPFLHDMLEQDSPDFARDVAIPLPGIVIADSLGVARDDIPRLMESTVAMVLVKPDDPDFATRRAAAIVTLDEHFQQVVVERRARPGDDLVSALTRAEVDGEQLSDEEIVGFARALFNGGHGTTTTLLGDSVVALARAPSQRTRLVDDPSLMPRAVEELLRYVSPVQGLMRTVTRDVSLHGQTMAAGDRLLVLLAAANRDPRELGDPDHLDVTRDIPRHLGFGVGPHHCIGAQLARVETEVVLTELLRLAPGYEIAGDIHYENILSVRSLHHVPIR